MLRRKRSPLSAQVAYRIGPQHRIPEKSMKSSTGSFLIAFLQTTVHRLSPIRDEEIYDRAGQGGFEIRTYIALAGLCEGCKGNLWFYAPIPIFAVGCTIASMEITPNSTALERVH